MPRASRFYLPGYVWHITHRCHKKEFLLKFDRDKRRWIRWLFEAKKRYCIEEFVSEIKNKLGVKAERRKIDDSEGHSLLHEPGVSYK